jgi:hypothetical protein
MGEWKLDIYRLRSSRNHLSPYPRKCGEMEGIESLEVNGDEFVEGYNRR